MGKHPLAEKASSKTNRQSWQHEEEDEELYDSTQNFSKQSKKTSVKVFTDAEVKVMDLTEKQHKELLYQGRLERALQEFQFLGKTHLNRITFVMLYKLAFQMNLQITYIIISVFGLVVVMSMLHTFCTELYDVYGVASIFRMVNHARSGAEGVKKKAFRLGDSSSGTDASV